MEIIVLYDGLGDNYLEICEKYKINRIYRIMLFFAVHVPILRKVDEQREVFLDSDYNKNI